LIIISIVSTKMPMSKYACGSARPVIFKQPSRHPSPYATPAFNTSHWRSHNEQFEQANRHLFRRQTRPRSHPYLLTPSHAINELVSINTVEVTPYSTPCALGSTKPVTITHQDVMARHHSPIKLDVEHDIPLSPEAVATEFHFEPRRLCQEPSNSSFFVDSSFAEVNNAWSFDDIEEVEDDSWLLGRPSPKTPTQPALAHTH
jgi:hypothetical protein